MRLRPEIEKGKLEGKGNNGRDKGVRMLQVLYLFLFLFLLFLPSLLFFALLCSPLFTSCLSSSSTVHVFLFSSPVFIPSVFLTLQTVHKSSFDPVLEQQLPSHRHTHMHTQELIE